MKGKVYYVNTGCYIHGTVRYPREAQIRTHRPTASTYLRTVWSRFLPIVSLEPISGLSIKKFLLSTPYALRPELPAEGHFKL